MQVNSLGLTEQQPENNVQRIVLEALAVTLGRSARARAIQLPAWNEALGLPRPWDQQWSLRIQQVLAFETDLLEYPDIFEGSKVMEGLVAELVEGARGGDGGRRRARRRGRGRAVHEGRARRLAPRAHPPHRGRRADVVGLNKYDGDRASPLTADAEGGILVVDPATEAQQRAAVEAVALAARRRGGRAARWTSCAAWPSSDENIMEATIAAARAGVTTGEWAQALRDVFGSYRAPTGVGEARASAGGDELEEIREEVERVSEALGRPLKILVGKPGLDGHSNGAEQIAVRARDAGMDVVYEGIRLTPAQIAASALQEGVHVVGLSILSGSHRELIPSVIEALREAGVDAPVVVGGIIPEADVEPLQGRRRRRGLHAQGLRPLEDHARHRGARRRASATASA